MSRRQRIRFLGKGIVASLAVVLATLVIIEGLSSIGIFAYEIVFFPNPGLSSRVHVQHDRDLGWVNIPDLRLPEMYGPGREFRTNSQSFRSPRDFEPDVPAGVRRIICSGDSFTLGIGVRGGDTWCSLLSSGPGWESVNMGEAGYGLGQIYLKFERKAAPLEHNRHVFAFISDSFRRLLLRRFVAWNKPVVALRNGELVVDNLPVRRRLFFMPWLLYNSNTINRLRGVDLGQRVLARLRPRSLSASAATPDALAVPMAIFERVEELNAAKGSRALFVYLPSNPRGVPGEEERLQDLRTRMEAAGLDYLDLASEFSELPRDQREGLFDAEWGHLSAAGNEWVANRLRQRVVGPITSR